MRKNIMYPPNVISFPCHENTTIETKTKVQVKAIIRFLLSIEFNLRFRGVR
jgi:hypothetical protein